MSRFPVSEESSELDVITRTEAPKRFKVILLNDDFTPMEFVTFVLRRFFSKTEQEAEKIMMDVHKQGSGVAGVYSREIAEMKIHQVHELAQQNEYPLKATMEAE